MKTIELRELISLLTSNPIRGWSTVIPIVFHNSVAHWIDISITLIVFLCFRWLLRGITKRNTIIVRTENRKHERSKARKFMASSVVSGIATFFFVVTMLGLMGITLSSNTVGWVIGGLTIAIGFLAQSMVKNLSATWHIISEDQYGVGDYIDAGFGYAGVVTKITLWSTRLKAYDGAVQHIRNADIVKISNRTQSSGALLVDIEFTAKDEHFISSSEVDDFQDRIVDTLSDVRRTLRGVKEVSLNQSPSKVTVSDVADVIPILVPNLTTDTLVNMQAIPNEDGGLFDDGLELVQKAISKAPAGTTPVFKDIEMLGLMNSTISSVTLRVRVGLLEQASRSYAMGLLRRSVYDEFAKDEISTNFSVVPEGEVIN